MIKERTALTIILVFAIAGVLFSGYLSYGELFADGCKLGCSSAGDNGKLLGAPVCVYGLTMYAIILVTTIVGLFKKSEKKD